MYYTNIRLSWFGGWQPVTEFTVDKRGDCPIFLHPPAHLSHLHIVSGRHSQVPSCHALFLAASKKLLDGAPCNLIRLSQRMTDQGA
jgi:hypothetical protein